MLQLLNFKDFWSEIGRAVMSFNSVSDVLDVILVTFVIYSAIKLIRETKAVQLAKGLFAPNSICSCQFVRYAGE